MFRIFGRIPVVKWLSHPSRPWMPLFNVRSQRRRRAEQGKILSYSQTACVIWERIGSTHYLDIKMKLRRPVNRNLECSYTLYSGRTNGIRCITDICWALYKIIKSQFDKVNRVLRLFVVCVDTNGPSCRPGLDTFALKIGYASTRNSCTCHQAFTNGSRIR